MGKLSSQAGEAKNQRDFHDEQPTANISEDDAEDDDCENH
jgi:hypothetical protein